MRRLQLLFLSIITCCFCMFSCGEDLGNMHPLNTGSTAFSEEVAVSPPEGCTPIEKPDYCGCIIDCGDQHAFFSPSEVTEYGCKAGHPGCAFTPCYQDTI